MIDAAARAKPETTYDYDELFSEVTRARTAERRSGSGDAPAAP
jgi:hypothetical protein